MGTWVAVHGVAHILAVKRGACT